MRTITIAYRNKPPGYSDPGSAISSAKEMNSRFHSEIEVRNFFGRVIKRVTYGDCRCAFAIDDVVELVVEVVAEDANFRCSIRSINDEASPNTNDCEQLNVVVGVNHSAWDRKGIVDEIVGKRLENLFFNGINIYLYFSGGMAVAFNSVVTVPDGHPLLYWTFAD